MGTVRYCAVLYGYCAVLCGTVRYCAVLYGYCAVLCGTVRFCAVLCGTVGAPQIEKYLVFREGEVWAAVHDELVTEGVRPGKYRQKPKPTAPLSARTTLWPRACSC